VQCNELPSLKYVLLLGKLLKVNTTSKLLQASKTSEIKANTLEAGI
jgi:hypothetical protein